MVGPQVQVEISGNRTLIILRVFGYLSSYQFYTLIGFLRERGFVFDRFRREWFKSVSTQELDSEMNELENVLIDLDIVFVNTHPIFRNSPFQMEDSC